MSDEDPDPEIGSDFAGVEAVALAEFGVEKEGCLGSEANNEATWVVGEKDGRRIRNFSENFPGEDERSEAAREVVPFGGN